jgi:hypothetical protein
VQYLEKLFQLDLLKDILALEIESRLGHQPYHLLRPTYAISAHVDTVPQIHLLYTCLYVVEDAQCVSLLLLILKGVLGRAASNTNGTGDRL